MSAGQADADLSAPATGHSSAERGTEKISLPGQDLLEKQETRANINLSKLARSY
jgi:hypothetical protein